MIGMLAATIFCFQEGTALYCYSCSGDFTTTCRSTQCEPSSLQSYECYVKNSDIAAERGCISSEERLVEEDRMRGNESRILFEFCTLDKCNIGLYYERTNDTMESLKPETGYGFVTFIILLVTASLFAITVCMCGQKCDCRGYQPTSYESNDPDHDPADVVIYEADHQPGIGDTIEDMGLDFDGFGFGGHGGAGGHSGGGGDGGGDGGDGGDGGGE